MVVVAAGVVVAEAAVEVVADPYAMLFWEVAPTKYKTPGTNGLGFFVGCYSRRNHKFAATLLQILQDCRRRSISVAMLAKLITI